MLRELHDLYTYICNLYTNRPYKHDWTEAWKKEWKGLNDYECFINGMTLQRLKDMGVLGGPGGKKLVNSQMLFENKFLDGWFSRYKARLVINGHPGAVRKGIDYETVFAAAPHLQMAPGIESGVAPGAIGVQSTRSLLFAP